MRGLGLLAAVAAVFAAPAAAQAAEPPAGAAISDNLEHVARVAGAAGITEGKFDSVRGTKVLVVTGRFGFKTYDVSDPENPELLDEFLAAYVPGSPPGDLDGLVELYEPSAVFEPQPGVVVHGHTAIRHALSELLAIGPTIRAETLEVLAAEDLAAPHLLDAEVGSVLRRLVRGRRGDHGHGKSVHHVNRRPCADQREWRTWPPGVL